MSRGARVILLVIAAVVAVTVLFTVVFPWIDQRFVTDPVVGLHFTVY